MEAQETRSERLTLTLTPSEHNDSRLVASALNTDLSTLHREHTVADVRARAREIRELFKGRPVAS
jgi:hypothetical protein